LNPNTIAFYAIRIIASTFFDAAPQHCQTKGLRQIKDIKTKM